MYNSATSCPGFLLYVHLDNNRVCVDNNRRILDCATCASRKENLFKACGMDELECINSSRRECAYPKGSRIFGEGEDPSQLFCISEGLVKIVKEAPNRHHHILRIARPGELIGYRALVTNEWYSASAIALEDCHICTIDTDVVFRLVRENPEFNLESLRYLSALMEQSYAQLTSIAYKPVRGRVAEALILLQRSYMDTHNPHGIIHMNRRDLASFTGTVKESLLRILREFRDEELIETDGSDITIKDLSGLIRISALYD